MSSTPLLRMPEAPRWDPDSGVNPFRWIVATAPSVRDARQNVEDQHRQARRFQRLLDNRPLKP